jgi:hypothetical protein
MLDRGYVVAATDYPGLGTPEVHPYLVGTSEAHAVLDSVRAARAIPEAAAGTHRRIAIAGRAGGFVHRPRSARHAPELSCWRRSWLRLRPISGADDGPSRHGRGQQHHRHDALVVGARLWRADGRSCQAASRAGHRPSDEALHRAMVRYVYPTWTNIGAGKDLSQGQQPR